MLKTGFILIEFLQQGDNTPVIKIREIRRNLSGEKELNCSCLSAELKGEIETL